jgi:glutaredoxin 3
MAKEYLSSHGVEFDAKDVATNPAHLQEMMAVTGGARGVPVLVVGSEVVRGFNREKVAGLLGLHA